MAILDTEKVDFLWKRIIFGVTKTAGALVKFGSNETIASSAPVLPSNIWADGDTLPATPVASLISAAFTGATRIRMTADPTAPPAQAWIATQTYDVLGSRLGEFIPPTFGSGYAVRAYLGDPRVAAARIFPDTTGEEWVFDYSAGVLVFTGTIPINKDATIGSGTFSAATDGVYIELYRYIGAKGASGGGGSTPTGLGTMSVQDADDINVTGGRLDSVILTNVTIDGGTFD